MIDEYGNKVLIKPYVQKYSKPENAYSWMIVRAKREDYTPETIVQEYEAYLKTTQPFRKTYYTINRRKQRRAYWCEEFGISPSGVSRYMVKNKKTFKEALEYFGIDTTDLDIQEY